MAVAAATPPQRDLRWLRSETRPLAAVLLAVGAITVALALLGPVLVVLGHGLTPVDEVIRGLKSNEMTGVLLFALVGGAAAALVALIGYRRMDTKVSREAAIGGGALGAQAAVLGAALLWWMETDVSDFARAFLDFSRIPPVFDAFVNGAKNTLFLAFASEFFGIVLGLFVALLAISNRRVVRAPARAYINFFRGTPLVWQLIFIGIAIPAGLGIRVGTYTAGIIAFSLNTGAYAAEVFRAGIRSIERGQFEAARGLGMSYLQAMRYAIVPQAVRRVVPPLMNEFVILIKDTALLIVLGLSVEQRDLMNVGDQLVANTFNFTYMLATGLGYLAITLPLIRLVNAVERRMRSGLVGVGA
ncbi:MAG: amino acid ABC transporter permease [Actinomycetota bacterium]|nr:amino acid ABC transporter permease [Actinomycetota bacterium]